MAVVMKGGSAFGWGRRDLSQVFVFPGVECFVTPVRRLWMVSDSVPSGMGLVVVCSRGVLLVETVACLCFGWKCSRTPFPTFEMFSSCVVPVLVNGFIGKIFGFCRFGCDLDTGQSW